MKNNNKPLDTKEVEEYVKKHQDEVIVDSEYDNKFVEINGIEYCLCPVCKEWHETDTMLDTLGLVDGGYGLACPDCYESGC